MTRRLEVTLLTLCLISLTGCDSRGSSDSSGSGTRSQGTTRTVQSSLDGFTVLPPHIRWTATTSVPSADVREVRFIVDHDRWWVDRSSPYSYGPDDADLPTRFISSLGKRGEMHSFKVKVITTSGERWSTVSHARVPEPRLARNAPGNFGRHGPFAYIAEAGRVPAGDLANPPPTEGDLFASFTGWLAFVRAGLFTHGKRPFAWEMATDGKRISLGTPIYLDARGGPASVFGYRTLRTALCGPDTTPATYSWSASQGPGWGGFDAVYLELRPLNEPCDARRKMLEGLWYGFAP